MALVSMTGFGRGEASRDGVRVTAELSSVNRKQFDLHLNMPRDLVSLESKIHAMVHKRVSRGHVKGVVRLSLSGGALEDQVQVDADLARAYVDRIRDAAGTLGLRDDLTARSLLQLSEVVTLKGNESEADDIWPLIDLAMTDALTGLVEMREKEGAALECDIVARFDRLRAPAEKIRMRAPKVVDAYEKTLARRLSRIEMPIQPDDPTLQRELAVFADRCDISEELTRLDSHFTQVERIAASEEPCGRALDFLCQEFFREVNTIGSKANDAAIAKHVITFKAGLEAVREQVQNVE